MFASVICDRCCNAVPVQVSGQDVETSVEAGGYYRLAFGAEETTCISYHATEDAVQASRKEYTELTEAFGGMAGGGMNVFMFGTEYLLVPFTASYAYSPTG